MYRKFTKNDFIERAKSVHGDKYDYSKVNYIDSKHNVLIICPIHGEFSQRANHHLQGNGCPKCAKEQSQRKQQLKLADFIERAKSVHGDKYDYSKSEYINNKTKVCIVCHEKDDFGIEHGEFWQTPTAHIAIHEGCPKCGKSYMTQEIFIKKSNLVHNNKYDYSKLNYTNMHNKVCIICPKHGEFWQKAYSHIEGYGCPKCAAENKSQKYLKDTETFIKEANEVHGNKYDYSKSNYIGAHKKLCIICPEHGEFWQTPSAHIAMHEGCPECKVKKSKLEQKIEKILEKWQIKYVPQKTFDWLNFKGPLSLDFFLSDYNIAIECQGQQHFVPLKYFGGEDNFNEILARDIEKKKKCAEHGIKIIYVFEKRNQKYVNEELNIYKNNTYLISLFEEKINKIIDNKFQK